jgi:hypothetical protein
VGVVEREERGKILGKMGDVKWVEVAAGSGAVLWWAGVFGAVVSGGRCGGGRGWQRGEPAFGERERERESEIKNEEVLGLNTVFNFFFLKK